MICIAPGARWPNVPFDRDSPGLDMSRCPETSRSGRVNVPVLITNPGRNSYSNFQLYYLCINTSKICHDLEMWRLIKSIKEFKPFTWNVSRVSVSGRCQTNAISTSFTVPKTRVVVGMHYELYDMMVNACFCCVIGLVFPYQATRLAWGTSPKWRILCRVGRKP